jgi:hypothetical protein
MLWRAAREPSPKEPPLASERLSEGNGRQLERSTKPAAAARCPGASRPRPQRLELAPNKQVDEPGRPIERSYGEPHPKARGLPHGISREHERATKRVKGACRRR